MANIKANKSKDGTVISYRIRVSDGIAFNGKQRFKTMTWKVPHDMTEKAAAKEAERVAILFEDDVKNGIAGSQRSLKLADFLPTYFSLKENILSPRTYELYKRFSDSTIIPALGHIKVADIKPAHVQLFIKYLNENSPTKPSPSTLKRKVAILQSILHQAEKLGLVQYNAANASKLEMPKQITPQVEIFSRQEAVEMLQCLEEEPLQYKTLVYLALMSGAREGELVALKFSDINFVNRRITISRSAYKLKGEEVATKPPKDNDIRSITVDEYTIELIRQLHEEKQRERLRLGTAWNDEEWLFTTWDGHIMHPATPSHWFRDFLKRHGLKHRKFHALRHTSATLLLLGGSNIKQVSGRLGHADLRVTNQYLHCLQEADTAAAGILQDMLITQTKHSKEEQAENNIQHIG